MFILFHLQRAHITSPESLSTQQKRLLYYLLKVKNLKEHFTSEKEILRYISLHFQRAHITSQELL